MVNEMVSKLTSECWDKCITGAPGSKFSSSETTCLTNCTQRFLDMSEIIAKRFGAQWTCAVPCSYSSDSVLIVLLADQWIMPLRQHILVLRWKTRRLSGPLNLKCIIAVLWDPGLTFEIASWKKKFSLFEGWDCIFWFMWFWLSSMCSLLASYRRRFRKTCGG